MGLCSEFLSQGTAWLVLCLLFLQSLMSVPFLITNIPLCFTSFPSFAKCSSTNLYGSPAVAGRSGCVSMGKKPGQLPSLGLAS